MHSSEQERLLPKRRIERLSRPFVKFLHVQSSSGILLGLCTVFALFAANSKWADAYLAFWNQRVRVGIEDAELSYPLWYWINDGLMAIFFFVIGLEIKRELTTGELREPRRIILPVAAAIGGAALPVSIFLTLESSDAALRAWAVPMATDIAFVMGCLALLGDRVPRGLKVLLLSIAIVDDILGVTVIALFYTETLKLGWGVAALGGLGLTFLMKRLHVREIGVYVVIGAVTWLCTLKTGVHPTIAGVIFGIMTPAKAWLNDEGFLRVAEETVETLRSPEDEDSYYTRHGRLGELSFAAREAVSPLIRLEDTLHPWVAFLIMPVFALANAGVPVSMEELASQTAMAISTALVVGKPLGIALMAFVFVRIGWAKLPEGVKWSSLIGGGFLSGIGFTMALFIASLALAEPELSQAKVGILLGSAVSGVLGMLVLAASLRKTDKPSASKVTAPISPLAIALTLLFGAGAASAQEVAFESGAQLPVLVSPMPQSDDDELRLSMHANVERRSRIFYLGLAASALYSPTELSHLSDSFELRPQIGVRFRSATQGAADFVAERVAIVGPFAMGEVGFRAAWKLTGVSGIYARAALRGGFDVTRVDAKNLGRGAEEASEVVSAAVLYAHGALGGHIGPFQLGVELEYFNVASQSEYASYREVLEGTISVPFFALFRLSRQVYFYFRAMPFNDFSQLPYTWGIAAVLNPNDP